MAKIFIIFHHSLVCNIHNIFSVVSCCIVSITGSGHWSSMSDSGSLGTASGITEILHNTFKLFVIILVKRKMKHGSKQSLLKDGDFDLH